MQVFNTFLKIFKKNIPGMSVYMVIFIALALAMPLSVQRENPLNFVQTELKIAVDNEDEGLLGSALMDYFKADNEVMDVPDSEEALLDSIYNREIDYVLYIPKDFTKRFIDGERTGVLSKKNVPASMAGTFADGQINRYLAGIGMYMDGGFSIEEAIENTAGDYEKEAKVEFYNGLADNKKAEGFYYFQFIPYILICVCLVGLGPIFMAFRRKEIKDRNNCSAMPFGHRNMQLVLGACVVGAAILAILLGAAFVIYKESMMSERGFLSIINSAVFLLLAGCLTYVVSQLAANNNVINMISNVLGLGFSFLGGVFVPLEIMGETVTKVSKFVPSYWYVINNEKIWNPSVPAALSGDFAVGILIQLAFTFTLLCTGLVINRLNAKAA